MYLIRRKFEITDAIILGYFSFAAYLLSLAKEFGYLSYFDIPPYFIHQNILEEINNFLVIVTVLTITYLIYQWIFEYSSRQIQSLKTTFRFRKIKIAFVIFFKIFTPIILPYTVFFLTEPQTKSLIFYILSTLILISFISLVELELRKTYKQHLLINQIALNIVWLLSNFIIFWSAGVYYAKHQTKFLSIDEGKTVVIYFSSDKMFTKQIINTKMSEIKEFSILNLSDSTYHFKMTTINR